MTTNFNFSTTDCIYRVNKIPKYKHNTQELTLDFATVHALKLTNVERHISLKQLNLELWIGREEEFPFLP